MDSGKLKGIRDWPTLTMVKQVQAFLGFGNFYYRFIWHFSELAKPLNDLLKKDNKFEWTSDCQKAFDELKKHFTEEPVLLMIQMAIDIPFHLFQKPSLQLKETMKSTIENYWQ